MLNIDDDLYISSITQFYCDIQILTCVLRGCIIQLVEEKMEDE